MNDATGAPSASGSLGSVRRAGIGVPLSYASLGWVLLACDILMISSTAIISLVAYSYSTQTTPDIGPMIGASMVISALFTSVTNAKGLYKPSAVLKKDISISEVLLLWIGVFLFAAMAAFLLKTSEQLSRGAVAVFFVLGAAELVGRRYLTASLYRSAVVSGRLRGKRVLVVSEDNGALQGIADDLLRHGYDIVAALPGVGAANSDSLISQLSAITKNCRVDEILVVSESLDPTRVKQALATFRVLPVRVRLVTDTHLSSLLANAVSDIGPRVAIDIQRAPLTRAEELQKRSVDVLGAGLGLILLAPIFVLIGAIIRIDSRGPAIFRQHRIGFNGQKFLIYKFRTMTTQDNGSEVRQATRRDSRVTSVGRFLRRSSIDELPQLINVLKGEMSLVGPRPHAVAHDTYYDAIIADYALRHHVKPGITGWAQVCGYRGETRTPEAMARRVEHDLWYVANWSIALDVRILFRTIFSMAGHNIY